MWTEKWKKMRKSGCSSWNSSSFTLVHTSFYWGGMCLRLLYGLMLNSVYTFWLLFSFFMVSMWIAFWLTISAGSFSFDCLAEAILVCINSDTIQKKRRETIRSVQLYSKPVHDTKFKVSFAKMISFSRCLATINRSPDRTYRYVVATRGRTVLNY